MKRGFTLIELLVVIGMIAILTGAASSSVMKARKRSQIARAETEVREMTNAILAYENWDDDRSLKRIAGTFSTWTDAKEGNLAFILGGVQNKQGTVPVLYNAAIVAGAIRDPWGTPYQCIVKDSGNAADSSADSVGKGLSTFMYLPNLNRLTADEMRGGR